LGGIGWKRAKAPILRVASRPGSSTPANPFHFNELAVIRRGFAQSPIETRNGLLSRTIRTQVIDIITE
jgi:hypothetical protein